MFSQTMIQNVIFDWNGTILADTEAVKEADCFAIRKFGGEAPSHQEYFTTECPSAIDFYAHFGCDKKTLIRDIKKVGHIQNKFYQKRAARCRSRRGTRELLQWLHNNSINTVILSNHNSRSIHSHLRRLRLGEYFSHVLAHTQEEGYLRARDKLKRLQRFAKSNGIISQHIAIIGDSPEEIRAGRKLGMLTIAIINGCHSVKKLAKEKPDHFVSNMKQCIGIFQRT